MHRPTRIVLAFAAAGALALAPALATAANVWSWRTEDGSVAFTDDPKKIPARYKGEARRQQTGELGGYAALTRTDTGASARHAARLERRLARLRALNAAHGREHAAAYPTARPTDPYIGFHGAPLLRTIGPPQAGTPGDGDVDGGTDPVIDPGTEVFRGAVEGYVVDADGNLVREDAIAGGEPWPTNPDGTLVQESGPFGAESRPTTATGSPASEVRRFGEPRVVTPGDPGEADAAGTGRTRQSRTRATDEFVPTVNFAADPTSRHPVVVEKLRVRDRDTFTTRHVTVVRQGDRVLGVIKPRAKSAPPYWADEEDLEGAWR